MRKIYKCILLCLGFGAMAQTNCEIKLESAKEIIENHTLFKDYNKLFGEILPCADAGDHLAENYIGLMYVQGLGVTKDESTGFLYIKKSAEGNNPAGQNNLGDLYRQGQGCNIDMYKAVEWYQKAADNKNSRAAYSLGYMYLKGFGVSQDYAKAIYNFKKSNYDMAKHWLGVCYYLGYGVPQNTTKALEYLYGNKTLNSKAFLNDLKIEKREQILSKVDQAIYDANETEKKIDQEVTINSRELVRANAVENRIIKTNQIVGEWTGRFIEYDWSGKIPLRVLPIDVIFSTSDKGILQAKIDFQGKTFEDVVLFENNNIFIEGFNFKLDQLYNHSFKKFQLEYNVLGMDMSLKTYDNVQYLLADVDSFISNWKEPGTPISLVLRPKAEKNISKTDESVLLALASQESEYVKVFPIPFNEQLYVGFESLKPAKVKVSIISIATAQIVQIASGNLDSGMQSITLNTANLPTGYYIIQAEGDEKLHTRIVVKQ